VRRYVAWGAGFISLTMVTKYAGQTGTLISRQGPKIACQLYNDSMQLLVQLMDQRAASVCSEVIFRFQTHSGVVLLTSSPHRIHEISINAAIPLEYATLITIESFRSAFRR
jgi:hypothetical protein